MLTLNKAKKIVCLLILIMILLPLKTLAVVSQTNEFYVNDYAKILSSETKEYIINTNIELQKKTGAQIVVVTVSSLGGQSIEEYATELFRKFGIGDKNKNNGVLLLCSTGDRLFRIEVGYGLEGRLTDGKTGRIQDEYIIPYLKRDVKQIFKYFQKNRHFLKKYFLPGILSFWSYLNLTSTVVPSP